jgi:hypothetical protein
MKAGIKNTRWLLIALLFGFVAIAGLTLVHHHGSAVVAQTDRSAAPGHAGLQQPNTALLVASSGQPTLRPSGAMGLYRAALASANSNGGQAHSTGGSGAPANSAGTSPSNQPAAPAGSGDATSIQANRPTTPAASHLPQQLGNGFAYNGYALLDCELPAGCGASGGAGYGSHQPSGTSGGQPLAHDSQGSSPPDNGSVPPANDDSNPPTVKSDPIDPGSKPVASAPELNSAALAGAITLLLGSLAVVRSRRTVRVTR